MCGFTLNVSGVPSSAENPCGPHTFGSKKTGTTMHTTSICTVPTVQLLMIGGLMPGAPEPAAPAIPLPSIPVGVHPGQVLRQWLALRKLTQTVAAELIGMSRSNLNLIICGHRRLSPETALQIGTVFHTGPDYWLQIQNRYDIHRAALRARRQGRRKKGGGGGGGGGKRSIIENTR
jgi:addiction module HigA family antidote